MDEAWDAGPPIHGRAESAPSDATPKWKYAAVILVPDVESRRGWREYFIDREPPPKPGARGIGF